LPTRIAVYVDGGISGQVYGFGIGTLAKRWCPAALKQ
jgi:hypothetical protein